MNSSSVAHNIRYFFHKNELLYSSNDIKLRVARNRILDYLKSIDNINFLKIRDELAKNHKLEASIFTDMFFQEF